MFRLEFDDYNTLSSSHIKKEKCKSGPKFVSIMIELCYMWGGGGGAGRTPLDVRPGAHQTIPGAGVLDIRVHACEEV